MFLFYKDFYICAYTFKFEEVLLRVVLVTFQTEEYTCSVVESFLMPEG